MTVVSTLAEVVLVNARFLLNMVCVTEDQAKEETHAFKEEL